MARAAGAGGRAELFARYAPWTAFLLGALQSLAFAPFELWPLGPGCLALLWLLWQGVPPRRAARIGFGFGAGLFLAGTYWLYTSIHVFGKAPLALAILLMLGLVAVMGAYAALLGWLVARYAPARGLWRVMSIDWALWQLRHSSESLAFMRAHSCAASVARWSRNFSRVLMVPKILPQTSLDACILRAILSVQSCGTWQSGQWARTPERLE